MSKTDESRMMVNGIGVEYEQEIELYDGCEVSFAQDRLSVILTLNSAGYIDTIFRHGHLSHLAQPEQSTPPPSTLSLPKPTTKPTLTPNVAALYTADASLGEGSFGAVVRARRNRTGEVYALKMIDWNIKLRFNLNLQSKSDPKPTPTAPTRSRTSAITENASPILGEEEVLNMSTCSGHPNVCKIFGSFLDPGDILTLVLEYVNGGNLFDYIERYKNGMPEDDAKHIAYQMCNGMAYVHRMGIMHRDLKPRNILLTKDIPPFVKIADFGCSKSVFYQDTSKGFDVCGSGYYAAPEILNERCDRHADCFSVGVMIHEMLTGKLPHVQQKQSGGDWDGEKEGEADETNDFESACVRDVQERLLDLQYLGKRNLSDDNGELVFYTTNSTFLIALRPLSPPPMSISLWHSLAHSMPSMPIFNQNHYFISTIARTIITALLANAPEERLSMTDALQSSWFHDFNWHHNPGEPQYGDNGTSAISCNGQETQILEPALDSPGAQAQVQ
ncbi:kinase-like protein [Pholiota conissans]|uniref:Kinase-like protein n=1 Tax=Pholiota conissans TaxID=109636 RepID=A0A9P6CSD7_9AGAR|nr:kinase-like protein [Pholiota conissans]